MEGAVRRRAREHLADRADAAVARSAGRLDHDGGRAHAEDHPVPASVERQRRVLDVASVAAAPVARNPAPIHDMS